MRPPAPRIFSFLCLAVLAAAGAPPAADAARKAPGCANGRFVVTQGAELLGAPAVLVLRDGALVVEGACPTTGAVGRGGRKGTKLGARWDRCGAAENLRLRATARDCRRVRGKLRARGRRAAFVALPSACGDGVPDPGASEECDGTEGCADGDVCGAACLCEPPAQPLDCVVDGYPCRWGDVPPAVAQQSLDLARAAGAILDAGGTTAAAAAVLAPAAPAVLQYDERMLRFRLAGGRPVWVSVPGAVGPVDDGPPAASAAARADIAPRLVLASGKRPKSALVVDPYAWESTMSAAGPRAVTIFSGIDDYAGNVARLANTARGATTVDVSTFANFAGHNVVYVNSHGGRLCPDSQTNLPCYSVISTGVMDDEAMALLYDSTPGVDAWLRDGAWNLGVSADFFRDNYPGGLRDALVVLDACHARDSDIARALEGRNSNVAAWDGVTSWWAGGRVMGEFLSGLAAGRAITEVYTTMSSVHDAKTGAALVVGRRDVRIRELVRVWDAFTGQPLVTGGPIGVTGYTDDEEPDGLLLIADFLGAPPDEGSAYRVEVTVDGRRFVDTTLDRFAQPAEDYRWHAEFELALGHPVTEGQALDVRVTLHLPEGGTSVWAAVPRATAERFSPGRKWRGYFTRRSSNGAFSTLLQVEAIFERDPTEEVTSLHPTFRLTGGTMRWSIANLEGACSYAAPDTAVELGPDPDNYLKFDLRDQPPEYHGSAHTDGPFVELVRNCPGADPVVSRTRAGGPWFTAPRDQHYVITGNIFTGFYAGGGTTVHEWSLERLE